MHRAHVQFGKTTQAKERQLNKPMVVLVALLDGQGPIYLTQADFKADAKAPYGDARAANKVLCMTQGLQLLYYDV